MPRRAEKTKARGAQEGKRYPLNMRTTFELRRQLEGAAARTGRSLAQEAEFRIEHTFRREQHLLDALEPIFGEGTAGILLAIGEVMRDAGTSASFHATFTLENWWHNAYAFDQVKKGIAHILKALQPNGEIELPRMARLRGGPSELDFKQCAEHHGELLARGLGKEIADGETERALRLRRYLGEDLVARMTKQTKRSGS
jgi:hypothetical protein